MIDLISVVVPIYNVEKYLSVCVNSIINQTYNNLEIILVNDGSLDGSGDICDKYAKIDSRIKVIHKNNGGLSDARNTGIDISNGKYIMFIDSDDYIADNMIEYLYHEIKKNDSDISMCNIQSVDENGNNLSNDNIIDISTELLNQEEFWDRYYSGYALACVVAWNKLYKKELFRNIKYTVGKCNEDEFIIEDLVSQCNKIQFSNKRLYFYRQRNSSIMGQKYSIKRLDASEALCIRCNKFLDNNNINHAMSTLLCVMPRMMEAYQNLDMQQADNYSRYKQIKSNFNSLYLKLVFKGMSLKAIFKCMIFIVSEKLYLNIKKLRNKEK